MHLTVISRFTIKQGSKADLWRTYISRIGNMSNAKRNISSINDIFLFKHDEFTAVLCKHMRLLYSFTNNKVLVICVFHIISVDRCLFMCSTTTVKRKQSI